MFLILGIFTDNPVSCNYVKDLRTVALDCTAIIRAIEQKSYANLLEICNDDDDNIFFFHIFCRFTAVSNDSRIAQ